MATVGNRQCPSLNGGSFKMSTTVPLIKTFSEHLLIFFCQGLEVLKI